MLSKLALDSGSSLEDLRVSEYEETLLKRTLYVLRDRKRERFCVCVFMWMVPAYRREKECMLHVNVCACCIYVRLCVGVWTETLKKINYGKADGWEDKKKSLACISTRAHTHFLSSTLVVGCLISISATPNFCRVEKRRKKNRREVTGPSHACSQSQIQPGPASIMQVLHCTVYVWSPLSSWWEHSVVLWSVDNLIQSKTKWLMCSLKH